jgi:hypothetical protein
VPYWPLAVLVGLLVALASAAYAQPEGVAAGHLGLVDTDTRAYGYSAYSGQWVSTVLDTPVEARLVSSNVGYLRTARRVYCFNPAGSIWSSATCSGQVQAEAVSGATAVCYTTARAYATATLWTVWRTVGFDASELPLGCASGGTFALVWTNLHAHAYHSASGQWISQDMAGSPPIAGIADDGFGLVWNDDVAYCFDPTPGLWRSLDLGVTEGISADGSGTIGVVWGGSSAQVYSNAQDQWYPLETQEPIAGASASGEVAIVWDGHHAYAFNPTTGSWSSVLLQSAAASAPGAEPVIAGTALQVLSNPGSPGRIVFRLPAASGWMLDLLDARGARVRRLDLPGSVVDRDVIWDGRDGEGRRLPSGSYWLRAESADRRVEARRFVLLP